MENPLHPLHPRKVGDDEVQKMINEELKKGKEATREKVRKWLDDTVSYLSHPMEDISIEYTEAWLNALRNGYFHLLERFLNHKKAMKRWKSDNEDVTLFSHFFNAALRNFKESGLTEEEFVKILNLFLEKSEVDISRLYKINASHKELASRLRREALKQNLQKVASVLEQHKNNMKTLGLLK